MRIIREINDRQPFFQNITSYLPEPFVNFIKRYIKPYHFYQDINFNPANPFQKKVLISYITAPLENPTEEFPSHTNYSECREIISIFRDLGYAVDVVHCLDEKHNPEIRKKKYDVIFGFGEPFYYAALQNPHAIKIIYLTEVHPELSYRNEKERIEYFYRRHNKRTQLKRSGKHFKTREIEIADFGIFFGNAFTSQYYAIPPGALYTLEPTGLINKDYTYKKRDFAESRKNFIWFGSYGAIHKGLDILVDAFSDLPEYSLYICGLTTSERKLFDIGKKNIHDLGFVHVETPAFIRLMDSCSFVILPSCAEGMATSVLTCMNHGLIPVVTRECGIDLQDWGIYIEDYRVESVKEQIKMCATCDPRILEKYHKQVYDYSIKKFNIDRYSKDFKKILMDILSKEQKK
jgi:glycosyltransferase involved in cell wall biosynthesis